MRRVPVGDKFAIVSKEDYELVSKYKWTLREASCTCYAVAYIDGKTTGMHNLIQPPPDGMVNDHISGNGLNNMRGNLRLCTPAQNNLNTRKWKNPTSSKYKGVSYHTTGPYNRPWAARITFQGKRENLGHFATQKEAALAYNEAAIYHFGEFAKLNDIS